MVNTFIFLSTERKLCAENFYKGGRMGTRSMSISNFLRNRYAAKTRIGMIDMINAK